MQSLDEDSVPTLFQAANARYLGPDQALAEIRQNDGIIPVAFTKDHRLVWMDIGDSPLDEWKFRFSIRNLIDASGVTTCFTTDVDILRREAAELGQDQPPAGFIFHMSKCGSTLMARVLDQSPNHIVLKEPTPLHERFWQYLTQDWKAPIEPTEENLQVIRNLIQIMGRSRLPQQQSYFVRVRSWLISFADIIQHAFPDTPCLFMYRDPVEVMASILSKPTTGLPRLMESGAAAFITGRSQGELLEMDSLQYFTAFYQRYLRSSLTEMDQHSSYLNYRDFTKDNLSNILERAFHYTPAEPILSRMLEQFDVYSKDDSRTTQFASDGNEKQRLVTPAMREAANLHLTRYYDGLESHQRNLTTGSRWLRDDVALEREEHRHAY